jgi:hypothetical protein
MTTTDARQTFSCRFQTSSKKIVMGLVLGAFGELSTSCYSLCTSIARVAAARLLGFWKMSPEQALAFSKQKILRFCSPGSVVGLASS